MSIVFVLSWWFLTESVNIKKEKSTILYFGVCCIVHDGVKAGKKQAMEKVIHFYFGSRIEVV